MKRKCLTITITIKILLLQLDASHETARRHPSRPRKCLVLGISRGRVRISERAGLVTLGMGHGTIVAGAVQHKWVGRGAVCVCGVVVVALLVCVCVVWWAGGGGGMRACGGVCVRARASLSVWWWWWSVCGRGGDEPRHEEEGGV